jgi:CubicO group peptidase (beta-lactamase class C family)
VQVERVPTATGGELLQRTVAALGRRHVGAVVGILDLADGQPLISGTGSLRAVNGRAPEADTTFEIGSITKTFTALALAHAVVTGRLSLDTPVRDIPPAGTSVPGAGRRRDHRGAPGPPHLGPAALATTSRSAGRLGRRRAR